METLSVDAAPILSTPDTHVFEDPGPQIDISSLRRISDEQLHITYEIRRTVDEIRGGRWKRIALQFPDHMLVDAPRISQALSQGLKQAHEDQVRSSDTTVVPNVESMHRPDDHLEGNLKSMSISNHPDDAEEKIHVLADTSYGACCVDEIAAEHADADVVVHYGRSCLSPTARLPVIYVFTKPPLDVDLVLQTFKDTYRDLGQRVVLMADVPYSSYVEDIADKLKQAGYSNIFVASLIHDTSSPLPNRTVPSEVSADAEELKSYQLFHISEPPPALLLILSSRVATVHIYPTNIGPPPSSPLLSDSTTALRRRYALLTRVSTEPIIGILINTLSVRSYLKILKHLKNLIRSAGKKAYTFVVGKVNPAKVANFGEVGGWVVIGCWESSLFESGDFWKPVITPWELELALKGDQARVWTGKWTSDFNAVLDRQAEDNVAISSDTADASADLDGLSDSEEESAPPEFDLRTGRYVSHSRPMSTKKPSSGDKKGDTYQSGVLAKRRKGELATIGSEVSPAAEYFKTARSWQGLGSDFEMEYEEDGSMKPKEGALVEEGRTGIAMGYVTEFNREA